MLVAIVMLVAVIAVAATKLLEIVAALDCTMPIAELTAKHTQNQFLH